MTDLAREEYEVARLIIEASEGGRPANCGSSSTAPT
jgi:hypothetical protein